MKLKNPRQYPYVLNALIGFDGFCNATAGGNCDESISSRLGRRRMREAIRGGYVLPGEVLRGEEIIPFRDLPSYVQNRLAKAKISWRTPLSALIYRWLEKIDKNHSLEAIGQ